LVELHAMIDISDGLAADVHHICAESHCGALLVAENIPVSDEAKSVTDGQSPLDHALSDGEDFELAFAVSPDDGRRLLRDQPIAGLELSHIGECIANGFWLENHGKRIQLEPRGWEHQLL